MPAKARDHSAADRSREQAQQLVATVAEMAPLLEGAASQAEADRTLPTAVVERMRAAGLFWLKTPRELGGSELDPLDFCDVLQAIAYCDASAAWAVMVGNGCTGLLAGTLPDAGVERMFGGDGRLPILAGQFIPRGSAVSSGGGYRVSGRWAFSSGIMHADWVVGGCAVSGTDERRLVCVPKSEATMIDTWTAAGLQGTGSHDFEFSDHFVPAELTMGLVGDEAKRGGLLFSQSHVMFVSNELSPVAVGIAQRAFDDMLGLAASTVRGFDGTRLSERVAFLKSVGQIDARLRAAELSYRDAVGEGWQRTLAGRPEDGSLISRLLARHILCASLCLEAVAELFRYGGGRVLASTSPMQRHYRNLIALSQHAYISDEHYEHAGAACLAAAGNGAG